MKERCLECIFFRNEPGYLEEEVPCFNTLSSAYGSVRSDAGICVCRDRIVSSWNACADFRHAARPVPG